MNKRGIFFTLMAIIILSIFLFSGVFYSDFLIRGSVQKRVETLDSFVYLTESDLSRQIYINGFRTIFILEKKTAESGNYQSNVDSVFQESFFNGTVYGQQESLLQGTNFSSIL